MDDYYNSISKGYNELHGEEQRKKLKIIKRFIKPMRHELLLDIGCGTGISSDFNCKVVGLDPNIELLKQNKKTKIKGIGENLPFKDKSFDKVVSLTALHHLKDISHGIGEIARVCKGRCALSILKKSRNLIEIEKNLKKRFNIVERLEEEKDIIFFLD
jgi:ubiquinone/menaquinone biosynthesis C-methylase UbiE